MSKFTYDSLRWERVAVVLFLYLFWFWGLAGLIYLTEVVTFINALIYTHALIGGSILFALMVVGLTILFERIWYWRGEE